MYEGFFGLSEKPFSLLPDPDFLYLGKNHTRALTVLTYGIIDNAGLTVLTGEVGAGKTTLIHKLLTDLDDQVTVGFIRNARSGYDELLEWVAMAFDLDYKGKSKTELYEMFNDFLVNQYSRGKRTVLIIDEAQNLSMDTLEELRMLTNINSGKHTMLQLLLSGQPELGRILQKQELRQLVQRISVGYYLEKLNLKDTISYIHHRMDHVGGDPKVFETVSMALIYYFSKGVPRLINTLSDFALLYAYAEELEQVKPSLVLDVIKDKTQAGIFFITHDDDEDSVKMRRLFAKSLGIDLSQMGRAE